MIKKIFLIGNPNVGKSVIFSRLTGVHVIASNYPGTTVEITKGFIKIDDEKTEVVDLPGAYSLAPSSKAEEVAVSLLREGPPEDFLVINIIDATNLERNLYLTLHLTHQKRWQEIGRIVEEVQHLSHRHHTLREVLEDASVRPLTGKD